MRDIPQHCQNLGAVVANLQSLEFYIRCVLSELPDSVHHGLTPDQNIYDCGVGHELLESPMTNFDTLKTLITKYNSAAGAYGWKLVDGSLVAIRDAIAHGRVAYPTDEHRFAHLMKFDKPRDDGKVRVSFNVELSTDWFQQQIKATKRALDTVEQASHDLQRRKLDGSI